MFQKLVILILGIVLSILTSGCDDLATQIAREAADRQVQQNTAMAELNKRVASGTHELVAAERRGPQEVIGVHKDLQAERTRLDTGWSGRSKASASGSLASGERSRCSAPSSRSWAGASWSSCSWVSAGTPSGQRRRAKTMMRGSTSTSCASPGRRATPAAHGPNHTSLAWSVGLGRPLPLKRCVLNPLNSVLMETIYMANLVLHCGARHVERSQLARPGRRLPPKPGFQFHIIACSSSSNRRSPPVA